MKIQLKSKTVLCLPSSFVLRFCLQKAYKKAGIPSAKRQTALLIRKMKEFRKANPDWYLIEMTEENGKMIRIKL